MPSEGPSKNGEPGPGGDAPATSLDKDPRFLALFDSPFRYAALLAPDGTVLDVNRKALADGHLSRDAAVGRPFWTLEWWGPSLQVQARVRDAVARAAQGLTVREDEDVREASESPFTVELSVLPIFGGAGDVVGLIAEGQDVTDRTKVERALRSSEERFSTAMRFSAIGMALVAVDGRFLEVNHAFCRLIGYSEEELRGKDFQSITHPDDLAVDVAYVGRMLRREIETYQMEKRYFSKDGRLLWVLLSVSMVSGADGTPAYFISQIQDISDRKRAEREIQALAADLERRVQIRTYALEEANRELEAFCYSVSHDLRAPLRHISGYVEMLVDSVGEALSDEARQQMGVIRSSTRAMGVLIDELLAFSRMGRAELREEAVDLNRVVRAAIDSLELVTRGRSIDWVLEPLPMVRGDASMLQQVYVNLLSNAVKYTAPRHTARIEVGCNGAENNRVVLVVRDNGVGFDMRYADKLFGVFQRLHHREEFEGTGVGLANVRRIVHRHGGRVWAVAKLNEGAAFYLTLAPAAAG